jgi:hypothetical protein
MERCHREIAAIEAELRAGNPDVAGLCLALSDWSAELRIIQSGKRKIPGVAKVWSPDDQSSEEGRTIGTGPHSVAPG